MNDWDQYEFTIASHYASAIINGDFSGLDEEETKRLNNFLKSSVPSDVRGHWDGFNEEDYRGFSRDDVSGLMADCYEARFVFRTRS